MGLSAINTYVGENKIADYVKYVRNDLMGIIREDLVYDLGRHVDDSVHLFEEWGLPIWKKGEDGFSIDGLEAKEKGHKPLAEGGTPCRSGKWQIMINGESYKVVVAEAAKKALQTNREKTGMDQNHFERVFIVKAVMDTNGKNVAAAIGFSVRENKIFL
jgi:adenylylsulfate reductase subunit A